MKHFDFAYWAIKIITLNDLCFKIKVWRYYHLIDKGISQKEASKRIYGD